MVNRRRRQARVPNRPQPDKYGRYTIPIDLLRLDTVMDIALIVLGVYILQAFLTTAATDLPGRISIVAWAVAIPLLSSLALLDRTQESFRYASIPAYLVVARGLGPSAALAGFVAAVWHMWTPAGIVVIASAVAGLILYRVYHARLQRDNAPSRPAD